MRLLRPASSSVVRASRAPALAAVAVLALSGLSACGGDEPDEASAPATSSSTSEETTASATPSESASATPKPSKSAKPAPAPSGLAIAVNVNGDRVEPQNEVVEADIGTPIRLQITSDREGEMHVHSSPEQSIYFGPGTKTFPLVIENPGAIDVEEHESGTLVLKLLVQ